MVIDSFTNEYSFLSNFYPCKVEFEGVVYPTLEHAYQAAKTLDIEERELILSCKTPGIAKRLGKKLTLRDDWNNVKKHTMATLLWQKFSTNIELKQRLIDTGDATLIEGNWWGDTYWGVCRGVGQNTLGKLLMALRSGIQPASFIMKEVKNAGISLGRKTPAS